MPLVEDSMPNGAKRALDANSPSGAPEVTEALAKQPISFDQLFPDNYSNFQAHIFNAGLNEGQRSVVPRDPINLEAAAKSMLTPSAYAFLAGGAGERSTIDANRLAFKQWKIVPRMMVPSGTRDLTTTLWGKKYDSPIICSPIGAQTIFHPDAELGTAWAAKECNIPFTISSAASKTVEECAAAYGGEDLWYQLYWPHDKSATKALLDRAKAAGYKVLLLTVDAWILSWRPMDLDQAHVPYFGGMANASGMNTPAFLNAFRQVTGGLEVKDHPKLAMQVWMSKMFNGKPHTWDELSELREMWDGPIVIKGIQHPEDAKFAYEAGMDGVVCSNHGGRKVDGAVASLEMLPEIVDAVKGKKTRDGHDFVVLFDSGLRTAGDIIKALALGAHACLVGRPIAFGLACNGKYGAKDVIRGLQTELDLNMGLAGVASVDQLVGHREYLRKCTYGGDVHKMN